MAAGHAVGVDHASVITGKVTTSVPHYGELSKSLRERRLAHIARLGPRYISNSLCEWLETGGGRGRQQ
jgi:hypothetical protein